MSNRLNKPQTNETAGSRCAAASTDGCALVEPASQFGKGIDLFDRSAFNRIFGDVQVILESPPCQNVSGVRAIRAVGDDKGTDNA